MAPFEIFVDPNTPPRPAPLRRAHTMPSPTAPLFAGTKENLDPVTGKPVVLAPVGGGGKKGKVAVAPAERRVLGAKAGVPRLALGKKAGKKGKTGGGLNSPLSPTSPTAMVPTLSNSLFGASFTAYAFPEMDERTRMQLWEEGESNRVARDLTQLPLADASEAYGVQTNVDVNMDVDVHQTSAPVDPVNVPLPASPITVDLQPASRSTSPPPAKRARFSTTPPRTPLKRSATFHVPSPTKAAIPSMLFPSEQQVVSHPVEHLSPFLAF